VLAQAAGGAQLDAFVFHLRTRCAAVGGDHAARDGTADHDQRRRHPGRPAMAAAASAPSR
jgi:hypothetical protein